MKQLVYPKITTTASANPDQYWEECKRQNIFWHTILKETPAIITWCFSYHGHHGFQLITKSSKSPDKLQLTTFDENDEPIDDVQFDYGTLMLGNEYD